MAQEGISYFPLDCYMDEKIQLIEAEYGLKGFAIVVKLFQKIYGGHGYYCEWSSDVELLFCSQLGEQGRNFVSEVVKKCLQRGIFSKTLYDKYQVLTSEGIQKRFFEITKRRKQLNLKNEYILIKNVNILGENVSNLKQRKGKESKVKESNPQTKNLSVLNSEPEQNDWANTWG